MNKLRITQVKSGIDRSEKQKRNLRALGLGRIGAVKVVNDSPQIQGMILKVHHLVNVETEK